MVTALLFRRRLNIQSSTQAGRLGRLVCPSCCVAEQGSTSMSPTQKPKSPKRSSSLQPIALPCKSARRTRGAGQSPRPGGLHEWAEDDGLHGAGSISDDLPSASTSPTPKAPVHGTVLGDLGTSGPASCFGAQTCHLASRRPRRPGGDLNPWMLFITHPNGP